MFVYSQSSGSFLQDGREVAAGYSGHGKGLNNPAMQNAVGVGPLPRGWYTIQPPTVHPKLGPVALQLVHDQANEMFGRDGFFIHGDNLAANHTASDGCIILPHSVRACVIAPAVLAGQNRLWVER